MMLTIAWFALKRMPRILMLLLLFINVFLLAFLLLGCSDTSSGYSSIYNIQYRFNDNSSIYSLIQESYEDKNLTGYEEMVVKAGYMNICVELDDEIECAPRGNLAKFSSITGVSIYTTNSDSSSTTLDLISLASDFSNDIVHPYILMATIIITIVLFLSLLYIVIPALPYKVYVNKFSLVLAPVLALVWGLGSMWTHVAGDAGQKLVEGASMGIITADVGNKATAMTWTPFAFMVLVTISIIGLHLRDLHNIIKDDVNDSKV